MSDNLKEHFDSILRKVENLASAAESLKIALRKLESEFLKPDYTQVDGITGTFNGSEIVTQSGEKVSVPQNYAAKSRLVFGDVLKKIEEDGKSIFKQIQKVERQQVEGILTKKEGEWYLLTDRGSYKVLDTAAEFLKAELNSEALAFIPADNKEAPFATLDKLISTQYLVNTVYQYPQQDNSSQSTVQKQDISNQKHKDNPTIDKKESDKINVKAKINAPPADKNLSHKPSKPSISDKKPQEPRTESKPALKDKKFTNTKDSKSAPLDRNKPLSTDNTKTSPPISTQEQPAVSGKNLDEDDLF